MLIEKNRWIRNGFAIGVESVKVVFRNPILFVYMLPALATALASHIFIQPATPHEAIADSQVGPYAIFVIITTIMSYFVACCLARHTMHILRQQPASLGESCAWVAQHLKQVLLWIMLPFFLIAGAILLTVAAIALSTMIGIITAIILAIGIVCILFCTAIGIPIIATETISVLNALRRAMHIVWNNLGTYIMTLISLLVIGIFFTLMITMLSLLLSVLLPSLLALITIISLVPSFVGLVTIIADTIFYHEFYVKREEVVVYPEQNF